MRFLPYKTFCSNFHGANYKLDDNGYLKSLWMTFQRIFINEREIKGIRKIRMRFDVEYCGKHQNYEDIDIYKIERSVCINDKSDESYGDLFEKKYDGYQNIMLNSEYIKLNHKEYK